MSDYAPLLQIRAKRSCSAAGGEVCRHFFIIFNVPKGIIQIQTMNLSLLLFLVGILGFILNRKNIILMIIAIELMLLSVTLLILISSFSFDDGIGQTFSIFIISIAGAESVVGLSILVAYYRLRGNISLRT
jgi:NADH-ubiquinone oxidoreductase chain 4L